MNKQGLRQVQHVNNENDVYQSIEERFSDIDEPIKQVQLIKPKNYILNPIVFPSPDPKTLRLFSIYQQNNRLIHNLKHQITRLENIKKESLYLKQQSPKANHNTPSSEFFLRTQQIFQQKQIQIQKLKKEIKSVDSEQARILMAKNQNIFDLSEKYFQEYKTVIDAKTFQDGLVMLTQERRRSRQRKEKTESLEGQVCKLHVRSNSSDSNDSKVSGMKINKKEKEKTKPKYLVRFINYDSIFSEFTNENDPNTQNSLYMVPLSSNERPVSISFNKQLNLVLVVLTTANILIYTISDQDSTSNATDNFSSHKTEHLYPKLIQVPQAMIQFDTKLNIKFCQIRNNQLFVLTSDGILRIYDAFLNEDKNFAKFKLRQIFCCFSSQKQIVQVESMTFSGLSTEQLIFITNTGQLCKINTAKYASQIVCKYDEKLIQVSPFSLETQARIFFSKEDFDPIQTRIIEKAKIYQKFKQSGLSVNNKGQNKEKLEKLFKIFCIEKGQNIYLIGIEKHGLLSGLQLSLQSMSPQVQIIEASQELQ